MEVDDVAPLRSGVSFFKTPTENGRDDQFSVPWVEKYRPKSTSEIVAQEVCLLFKNVLITGELPNLLFYGPPGTGKTSSILALARDLYGRENMKDRVLELNASDERGIQVIREKVKMFAQQSVANTYNKSNNMKLPCYKLIILDEADNMTSSAQAALRRIMESNLKSTRFCLICNYITKLIQPITSRCSKFYFRPLPHDIALSKLENICNRENITISPESLNALIAYSDGDFRKAVMYLQSCSCIYNQNHGVVLKNVMDVCGVIPPNFVDDILNACRSGNFDTLLAIHQKFSTNGYSVSRFLTQFIEALFSWNHIDDSTKAKIFTKMSDIDKALSEGADEQLQLLSLLAYTLELHR